MRGVLRDRGDGDVVGLLTEMLDVMKSIQASLERPAAARALGRTDRAVLERLLPVIAGVFGSDMFVIRELFSHASPALQIALEGHTAKQLGRLFRRAEGISVAGHVVMDDGEEGGSVLWSIRATL